MANHSSLFVIVILLIRFISSPQVSANLSVCFYANTCPSVFKTIRTATRAAIRREARTGASIIRLFFHDCFVNGCDGSVLLEDFGTFRGEQSQLGNINSLRRFEVIDEIKAQVDRACGSSVVSCADILAVAARDSVVKLGGPDYEIPVGRRDTRVVNVTGTSDLPFGFDDLETIKTKFRIKGFSAREMVALSGAHTVGQARCVAFRDRIYNQTNIDPAFAASKRAICPSSGGDNNTAPLDAPSPNQFGNSYFQDLLIRKGLLNSDQVLFNGGSTDSVVRKYSNDGVVFSSDFAKAMAKMGNLGVLTGSQGEVRTNCRRIN